MRILWIKNELLHPVDKGEKMRTYHMLKRIKQRHEVTFLALARAGEQSESRRLASEYCQRLIAVPFEEAGRFSPSFYRSLLMNLSSPLPYAIERFRSRQMRQEIAREAGENRCDVVVSDLLVPALNMPGVIPSAKVLFQHSVESERLRQRYETQRNPVKRSYLRAQWQKMMSFESSACKKFDAVVAVSESDRDFIRSRFQANDVYDVPTGIDTEYFAPLGSARSEAELVFTGSMDLRQNQDAIGYFVHEVLPLVSAVIPDVKITIVSRSQLQRSWALALPPAVTFAGPVDDPRPFLDRASVYVAPLRQGGDTQRRILEAMAMRTAVVTTSIGAEGLPVRDGDDLLVADNPRRFADAVIKLLYDRGFAERVGKRARTLVTGHFSWERAASVFSAVCEHAANRRCRSAGARA